MITPEERLALKLVEDKPSEWNCRVMELAEARPMDAMVVALEIHDSLVGFPRHPLSQVAQTTVRQIARQHSLPLPAMPQRSACGFYGARPR